MYVAEVVGNVWGEFKHESLKGRHLFLVRPIDPVTEKPLGRPIMAIDGGVGAGPGSVVLVVDEGNSARMILGESKAPVRTVICGIVDKIYTGGKEKAYA